MFRGQGFIRQGTGQFAHTGNQHFRKMIIGKYDEHSNIQRKTKKTGFVRIIVDEMRYDGIWLLNKIKTIGGCSCQDESSFSGMPISKE